MPYKVEIQWSDCDEIEDLVGDLWTLHSFSTRHGNFKHPENLGLGPPNEDGNLTTTNQAIRNRLKSGTAFICSCYQHSGTEWGLKGEVHQCRWDTAQNAGLLVFNGKPKEAGKDFAERELHARSWLARYTEAIGGQVYHYVVTDLDTMEVVDSCGGFLHSDFGLLLMDLVDTCGDQEIEWDLYDTGLTVEEMDDLYAKAKKGASLSELRV